MSAEDRLQALEQLVTLMQSEVLLARATAAQAEPRATDAETLSLPVRGEGVVDTRFLGKPKSFHGTSIMACLSLVVCLSLIACFNFM